MGLLVKMRFGDCYIMNIAEKLDNHCNLLINNAGTTNGLIEYSIDFISNLIIYS